MQSWYCIFETKIHAYHCSKFVDIAINYFDDPKAGNRKSRGRKLEEHWCSSRVHIGLDIYIIKNIFNVLYNNPMKSNVLLEKWRA